MPCLKNVCSLNDYEFEQVFFNYTHGDLSLAMMCPQIWPSSCHQNMTDSQVCKLSKQRPSFEVLCLALGLRRPRCRSGFSIIISKRAMLIHVTAPGSLDSIARGDLAPNTSLKRWEKDPEVRYTWIRAKTRPCCLTSGTSVIVSIRLALIWSKSRMTGVLTPSGVSLWLVLYKVLGFLQLRRADCSVWLLPLAHWLPACVSCQTSSVSGPVG